MYWKRSWRAWLIGAYIGVLGIVGAQRDRIWANDISYRETVRNTDFIAAGVGSLRDASSASLTVTGIKGAVTRAYLYWHGPMNTDFPLANATIRMDGQTITGVHIGTSDDNCWGFANSQGYRADVTPQVLSKRNGSYLLSQFTKQGTNVNANGASMLVFFEDGNTNNNRDVVLFEGNDSNAPNDFDALGWNAQLPGVFYSSGKAFLQMHVSDGQIYPDDSVILNGAVLQGRGSIFQGTSVPSANNGPSGFGNLWDIKTWDITSRLAAGTNNFVLTHGYLQQDCISLVVAVFNLPAASAPPPPPPGGTNNPPTVTGQPEITVHSPAPIVVEAEARDNDGDALDYTITVGNQILQTGEVPEGIPQTIGKLSLTNAFPLGDHQVVFTVSDGRTNASFTTIVHVIDNTAPVIHATNIVVGTDPGSTTAVVNYVVTATDDFPGDVAIVSLPPPGHAFPIGVTVVTVTAVDVSGNRSQTTFTVTVTDGRPRTIHCPPDIVRFADPGTNVAVVEYVIGTDIPGGNLVIVCLPPSGSVFPVGSSPVLCTATDDAGNRATCAFNVTVNLTQPVNHPPTLTGITNLVINSNAPIVVTATAGDVDGNALSYTILIDNIVVDTGTVPAGTPVTLGTLSVTNAFDLGVHTVRFEVNDGQAGTNFTTTIRVIDNTPPVIHVPPNIVVPVDPGTNVAVVNCTVTATDNFPGPVQVVVVPDCGTAFPLGTTVVVVTATDSSGNQTNATFTVTVIDNVPPSIICPTNLVRLTDPGTNVAVVTYTVTATDNLPGVIVTCVPPSGSVFPVGTSPVNCTARDVAGNEATCSFSVTVNVRPENRPPVLTGQNELTINSNAPIIITAVATDLDGDALTYTIRVDGVVVQVGTIPAGVPTTTGILSVTNGFSLGNHTVTFEVNDGKATATFTTTVHVIDNTPPVIQVPPNIIVPVDPGMTNAVVTYTVTATDNFPGPIVVVVVPESGSTFPLGTTVVVATATDASGNQTNATFTVTVIDNVPPTILCPPDLVRFAPRGSNSAVVTYTVNASDNVPGATLVCLPASGSIFPLGTTLVNCTVTDRATNQARCSFNVTVAVEPDTPTNRPPAVVGQPDITINHPNPIMVEAVATDDDGNPLTYTIRIDGVVVQTGTIPGGSPQTIATLAITNAFTLGNHTVTFQVNDGSATASFTTAVHVIDNTPPVIQVPANIVVPVDPGKNTAVVTYTVTATDNFPGQIVITSLPASGGQFPIGTTIVTVTATDASNNRATATFTITVTDNVPPVINCPPDLIRFTDPGTNVAVVFYTVNATDNLPGVTVNCVPPSGSAFPVGTTPVNCIARDAANNCAPCSFNVTIKDQPPVVTVPTNMIVAADLGQCSAVVNYSVTVVDNSPGWTLVCLPPPGSVFPAGVTTVVCIVTDAAGNRVTNSFTVTVVDREKPILHLPADITVTAATNATSAIVNYVVTATDNCSAVTLVTTPVSGSAFPVGTTIVQCTATDASGNVANGTFNITVLPNNNGPDTEPPVIVSITPSKVCLWPPNHKMVTVTFNVKATDNSGKPVTAQIISITSNEPENELGDGNTEHDWAITGSLKAQLRAERSGLGNGRIYTIVIAVKDAAGNVTTGVTTVCVPHDQGQKDMIMAASARASKTIVPVKVKLVRVKPEPMVKP